MTINFYEYNKFSIHVCLNFMRSFLGHDTTFKPITEATSVHVKKICIAEVGSCSTNMPSSTVPTAPIPVQTGYATLSGKVLDALISRYMLAIVNIMNPAIHSQCSVPVVTLAFPRQKVKEHSQKPAIIKITQFICCPLSGQQHHAGDSFIFSRKFTKSYRMLPTVIPNCRRIPERVQAELAE
jgi:hypothetical protein